jgi:hypothetical protein
MDIRLLLTSAGPHCKPIKCDEGHRVFLTLKPGKEDFAADGSGVLIAGIVGVDLICSNAGSGQWDYQFSIEGGQIAPGKTVLASDILGVCCIDCANEAMLAKLRRRDALNYTVESFAVFADDEQVQSGEYRLFRRHTGALLKSMEVSVAQIVSPGGLYPPQPGTLRIRPLGTPTHALGPWSELGSGALINPATPTPMTARFEFSPPLPFLGGRAFGVNVIRQDNTIYRGLEVHLQFSPIEP